MVLVKKFEMQLRPQAINFEPCSAYELGCKGENYFRCIKSQITSHNHSGWEEVLGGVVNAAAICLFYDIHPL